MIRRQGLSINEISAETTKNDAANAVVVAQSANQSSSQTQILENN